MSIDQATRARVMAAFPGTGTAGRPSSTYSQAIRDAAHDWLNNSDHADEYGEASDERSEEMLAKACHDIVNAERDELARQAAL